VALGLLPPATYTLANIQLNFFGGPDFLDLAEGFRVSLFTSGNSLISQQTGGVNPP